MRRLLRYGGSAAVDLEVRPEVLLTDCDAPRGELLTDIAAAVTRALAEPNEFPPLGKPP